MTRFSNAWQINSSDSCRKIDENDRKMSLSMIESLAYMSTLKLVQTHCKFKLVKLFK